MLNSKDIKCGLHSGFPPCCIAFWMLIFNKCRYINRKKYASLLNKNGTLTIKALKEIPIKKWIANNFKVIYFFKMPEWGYVMCPVCWAKNNKKSVKKCKCKKGVFIK